MNKRVDNNVATSAATRNLGEAAPMKGSVKPPVLMMGHRPEF